MNRLIPSGIAFALALFTMNGVADTVSPELGVKANNSLWEKAVNEKSSDFGRLYTEDAVVLPPSLEIIATADNINHYWFEEISPAIDGFELESLSIRTNGDTAYQTAVWLRHWCPTAKENKSMAA